MSRLGDPCTRPNEEFFFVPFSFDLEKEAQEWEGTALVVMAMSAPPSTGVREVEAVVLDEMRLHKGDVVVSRHQPQPFLLKFASRRLAEEAAGMRCIKHHGVILNVRPWRSLEAAFGAAMFFRVRLCLEGIPVHAWNPEIVERLIGRTCALDCIDTNLLHPDDTRTIDVWAWTPNPSRIPKRLWLVVTGRADAPSAVTVTSTPPAPWQKGAKFCVLIHLEWIYDYTSASTDHFGHGSGVMSEPERRELVWHFGAVDGEPAPVPATLPSTSRPQSGQSVKTVGTSFAGTCAKTADTLEMNAAEMTRRKTNGKIDVETSRGTKTTTQHMAGSAIIDVMSMMMMAATPAGTDIRHAPFVAPRGWPKSRCSGSETDLLHVATGGRSGEIDAVRLPRRTRCRPFVIFKLSTMLNSGSYSRHRLCPFWMWPTTS
ncbi:unnamed protein product [Urochloa humidicola]